MTGKIRNLNYESASGVIDAENGVKHHFDLSAVLAYDAAYLATGQTVTFDLENGHNSKAVNICVQKSRHVPHAEGKKDATSIRYMGFQQVASIRTFRFERTALGEETETFVVTADVTLFTKHHVGIQDGPVLCLRLLSAELGATTVEEPGRHECSFTEQHMLTHLASRPVPGARTHTRRVPRPAVASQFGAGRS
jgi:hypothetical protein